MKKLKYIWVLMILVMIVSCKPDNPDKPIIDPTDTVAAPSWVAVLPVVESVSWNCNLEEADLTSTMTVTATVAGSGITLSEEDRMGIFLGEQCLTMDTLRHVYGDEWRAFLVLPHYECLNQPNSVLYVGYYNAARRCTLFWTCDWNFVVDSEVGSFKSPYLLDVTKALYSPFSANLCLTIPNDMRAQYQTRDEMAVFVENECRAVVDLSHVTTNPVCCVALPMSRKEEDVVIAYYSAKHKTIRRSAPIHVIASEHSVDVNPLILN